VRIFEAKIVYRLVSPGESSRLDNPAAITRYLQSAYDESPLQEVFYAVYLDRRNRPLGRHLISMGTLTSTIVSPREVFRGAILAGAAAMVVSHNHPSGDPSPSSADLHLTRQLREAAKTLEIDLLDHVIAGTRESDPLSKGFYSFREAGLM
jgi:DNA repair protein RadC